MVWSGDGLRYDRSNQNDSNAMRCDVIGYDIFLHAQSLLRDKAYIFDNLEAMDSCKDSTVLNGAVKCGVLWQRK